MLGQVHHMHNTGQHDPLKYAYSRFRVGVSHLVLFQRDQTGAISLLALIIILLAPMFLLGGVAFVLILMYASRVSRLTKPKSEGPEPTVCPACGHKLVEIRNFCAECGAPIRPSEPVEPEPPETSPEEPA